MAILHSLCSLALGQLVDSACRAAGLGVGVPYIQPVVKFLKLHLTDHSQSSRQSLAHRQRSSLESPGESPWPVTRGGNVAR